MGVTVLWLCWAHIKEEAKRKHKTACECEEGKICSTQLVSPCDGRWSSYHAALSYTWLGTMSFCNSDPAIPEIWFTLFAHFSSHSSCQVCEQLSFPVWLFTSLSCSLWLVLPVPQIVTSHSLPSAVCSLWKQAGSWGSWESPILGMQMPTNPQQMHHLNTGIDWRVTKNQGLA